MRANALFICHAGSGIGLGHLSRCLVAASALVSDLGLCVDLIIAGDTVDEGYYKHFPVNVEQCNLPLDVLLGESLKKNRYCLLGLDLFNQRGSDNIDQVLKKFSIAGTKIIAIDNLPGGSRFIDLLYIPSFSQSNLSSQSNKIKVVSGWDCYLLNIREDQKHKPAEENILILTGGSDSTGLGKVWPHLLSNKLKEKKTINWVTGPYAEKPNFPTHSNNKFVEHLAPTNLTDLMAGATVSSTVFGVSFFELIALGVPTVVFSPYGNKDKNELTEIERLGVALVAEDEVEATELLSVLINNKSKRERLKKQCGFVMRNFSGRKLSKEVHELLTRK